MRRQIDRSVLEMAIIGYEAERQKIEGAIHAIQSQLGRRSTRGALTRAIDGAKPKRQMSAAARKRIAAAQKKRWAVFHAQKSNQAPRKTPTKRNLSPERKAALVANLKKAREAKAAKKATA